MSEYVIDHLTGPRQREYGSDSLFNLHIKIDKFGNINIKHQGGYNQQTQGLLIILGVNC